jgi:FkbM family methyltransferase
MISTRDFREAFESEREIIADILENTDSDDVFWDIGANVGVYTCFVSSNIPENRNIVAFEPHPEIRSYLMKNVSKNTPGSQIIPYGLTDTKQRQDLSEVGLAGHTIADTGDHDTIKISLTTAQKIVEEQDVPRPTVVKMDIEGAELAALEGFGSLLNHVRLLYCEVHPKRLSQMDASGDKVENFLMNAGFEVEGLGTRGSTYFLRCTRTDMEQSTAH